MSLVELRNVTKKFGEKLVLDKITFKVDKGEFIALMGPSGSGKSTLLNIIGLLENFDSGDLIIDGEINILPNSSKSNKILRNKISYLFQNFALVDDETVEYNLMLALKYVTGNKTSKKLKIAQALNYVGLDGFEKRKIFELSGGEQQRVSVARILLKPCDIVLADEPTGSLDEANRNTILNLLKSLNQKGKTVIIVTHDNYVSSQCHRVTYLKKV